MEEIARRGPVSDMTEVSVLSTVSDFHAIQLNWLSDEAKEQVKHNADPYLWLAIVVKRWLCI